MSTLKHAVTINNDSSNAHQDRSSSPKKATFQGWMIWGVSAVFYLYEYLLRASPSVMTHQLMQDFAITSTGLGLISSMYYYAYTPLQIPCGLIVDRLGARLVITLSCVLCFVGTFIFAQSEGLLGAQIGRFLIGAGSACAFLSTLKLASKWFPPHYFAVLSGMTTMMGITLGGYAAGQPLALFVNSMGWRSALIWLAIFGVGVALLCWVLIKNAPHKKTSSTHASATQSTLMADVLFLIKNPQTWLIALYGCLMYVTISAFAEMWAVPYLMKKYELDNVGAAGITAMIFLGQGVGAPGMALLSNYLKSRRKVMFLGTTGATLVFLSAIYLDPSILWMKVLLFCTGACSGAQSLCFALNQEANPHEISATTVGFTNTVVMISGLILLPLLGGILDLNWDGQLGEHGLRIYSIAAYELAMLALPVCLFIAWILIFFIKETFPKEQIDR